MCACVSVCVCVCACVCACVCVCVCECVCVCSKTVSSAILVNATFSLAKKTNKQQQQQTKKIALWHLGQVFILALILLLSWSKSSTG